MSQRLTVRLPVPAHEMAQEEIAKQLAFLSKGIANVHFIEDGAAVIFDAPADAVADLAARAQALATTVQRGLRSLRRKVVFRSPAADARDWSAGNPDENLAAEGVTLLGPGQVALEGLPLRLYRYFDAAFEGFGDSFAARPMITPVLIPSTVLARCDYFRSFPNTVTFAAHLPEDIDRIQDFRKRHERRDDLDDRALADLQTPEACLSPATCYHVYHAKRDQQVPAAGLVYGVCGRCFRYESSNMRDLRRLWDFTMREVVFLGARDYVLAQRDRSVEMMSQFLTDHALAGEIRTASDPFFIAPDAPAKTYFQFSSETKYEISLMLPGNARLAVGSHNYHTDFFGRAFNVSNDAGGMMHSVCVAFGLERWVYAFLAQHGHDATKWPNPVRRALS